MAILLALTTITTSKQDFVIFTESVFTLLNLNTKEKSIHPYVINVIRKKVRHMEAKGIKVKLAWIPAQVLHYMLAMRELIR